MDTATNGSAQAAPDLALMDAAKSLAATIAAATTETLETALKVAAKTAVTDSEDLDIRYVLDPPFAFVNATGEVMAATHVRVRRTFVRETPGRQFDRDLHGMSPMEGDLWEKTVTVEAIRVNDDGYPLDVLRAGGVVKYTVSPDLADLFDPTNADVATEATQATDGEDQAGPCPAGCITGMLSETFLEGTIQPAPATPLIGEFHLHVSASA